ATEEPAQAALLADGVEAVAATGEQLVDVGLVADIPDELVFGGGEHGVEGDGELDGSEAGAQVPAGAGDRGDELGAQLVGQRRELSRGERLEIIRTGDPVEHRRR